MLKQVKIKSVIEANEDGVLSYYTIEGVYIGTLGQNPKPTIEEKPEVVGAIVTPPTPEKVRRDRERENERVMSVDAVIDKNKS